MLRRPLRSPLLALVALLALVPAAHALDAARVAPALEATFPRTLSYVDCPFDGRSRTCVLLPTLSGKQAALKRMLAFVHDLPGVVGLQRDPKATALTFTIGSTAYRLQVGPSRARRGTLAATLSFGFDRTAARHAVCLRRDALVALARRPGLEPGDYAALATAIACHGPDTVDASGRTPLFVAIGSGNVAALLALLRGGADPNHIDRRGWTPLLAAAQRGTAPELDALLQAGADASYVAPDGSSLETLEPFNPHLAGRSAAALALPAPSLADLSLADPSLPAGPGATSGAVGSEGTVATLPEAGAARAATPANATAPNATPPAAGTPRPGERSAAAAGPAVFAPGEPASGGTVPLEVLALVVVVALALLRLRVRRSEPGVVRLTATQTDLPAMPVPGPYRRPPRRRPGADAPRDPDRPL